MDTIHTAVSFQINDPLVQKIFDAAERKLRDNLKDFAGRQVLIEGGGYHKIWLETQPMGGEMYAGRNMTAAINNQSLFMEYQRGDGRIPGSIMLEDGRLVAQFNKFQGFCFPAPALNMYYWMGCDREYLLRLQDALARFDAYLWNVRDSDGDGCLETWCMCDTGEDHARRYGDAPFWWEEDTPPTESSVVPIASMDIMSYSYAARDTLAKISTILSDEKTGYWRKAAEAVRQKMQTYLWSEADGACFDRDKAGRRMPTLIHNNLRCMYWGSFTMEMARRFVTEHLLNPEEFWTPMPLPSVAANDPLFYNNPLNDWSGQPEGLTYQRALQALEKYGYQKLLPLLAGKLFEAIGDACVFTQQFDPFTGKPSGDLDGYGPTMLAVLGYVERLYGVHLEGKSLWWGVAGGRESEYTQEWGDRTYTLTCDGEKAWGMVDGKTMFTTEAGKRITTDYDGNVQAIDTI